MILIYAFESELQYNYLTQKFHITVLINNKIYKVIRDEMHIFLFSGYIGACTYNKLAPKLITLCLSLLSSVQFKLRTN